jgi:hypothetical protein
VPQRPLPGDRRRRHDSMLVDIWRSVGPRLTGPKPAGRPRQYKQPPRLLRISEFDASLLKLPEPSRVAGGMDVYCPSRFSGVWSPDGRSLRPLPRATSTRAANLCGTEPGDAQAKPRRLLQIVAAIPPDGRLSVLLSIFSTCRAVIPSSSPIRFRIHTSLALFQSQIRADVLQ